MFNIEKVKLDTDLYFYNRISSFEFDIRYLKGWVERVHITDTRDADLPYPEPFTEGITIGQPIPYNTPEGKDGKWFYCFTADYEFDQEALEEEIKEDCAQSWSITNPKDT